MLLLDSSTRSALSVSYLMREALKIISAQFMMRTAEERGSLLLRAPPLAPPSPPRLASSSPPCSSPLFFSALPPPSSTLHLLTLHLHPSPALASLPPFLPTPVSLPPSLLSPSLLVLGLLQSLLHRYYTNFQFSK